MSDYTVVPISDTEGAWVQFPLALPRDERPAFLAALTDEDLAACECVPLAVLPLPDPTDSTEDAS
jgi:hypothetical protein